MADILSQEELDALLGQMKSDDDDDDEGSGDFFETAAQEELAEEVPDSLGEVAAEAEAPSAAGIAVPRMCADASTLRIPR